jgi:alpha/beta superfamily hydrolase
MHSFYFPMPEGDVFAVYHPPRAAVARQSAVLLCYPLGHEYLNSHRAYRHLATLLSEAGFPVLRFDYCGCGDSGGVCEEAGMELWLRNVSLACGQLKTKSNASRLCLLGLRFGASLAMMTAATCPSIQTLVLWDPVVQGPGYLEELKIFHKRVLDAAEASSRSVARPSVYDGLSLFGFGSHLSEELRQIDLLSMGKKPAEKVLVIESASESASSSLSERLRQWGSDVAYRILPNDESWKRNFDSVLLPGPIVPAVLNWVSEVCA